MKCCKKSRKKKELKPYEKVETNYVFAKHDNRNHVIDLEQDFDVDKTLNRIFSDKNIFYIKNSHLLYRHLSENAKHNIQNVLIDHKFNFETYPNDFIYCLISNHVYCLNFNHKEFNLPDLGYSSENKNRKEEIYFQNDDIIENNDDHCDCVWNELSSVDWVIHSILTSIGYRSIVYINETKKQIIVGYQGFKFKFIDLFCKNYEEYIEFLTKCLDENLKLLFENVKNCVELSNELNYSLSFAGYSIGALFAQLSVFMCHKYLNKTECKAVVFESFGVYELLNLLNNITNPDNMINLNDLNIKTYLLNPNYFNSINRHIGILSSPMENYTISDLKCVTSDNQLIGKDYIKKKNLSLNGKYFFDGLKSLTPINLKLILNGIKKCFSHFAYNWPMNHKITIRQYGYSKTFKRDVTIDFIKDVLRLFFEKNLKIKKETNSNTVINLDYNYNLGIFDQKILQLDENPNNIDNFLDKISQLRDVFNFKIKHNTKKNGELIEKFLTLQSKYKVIIGENNTKILNTRSGIEIRRIVDIFLHMCELDSKTKEYINEIVGARNKLIAIKQEKSKEIFLNTTNHLLNEYFFDFGKNYNTDKHLISIIVGQRGVGKSTLAAKIARDYINDEKNNKPFIKWIDCSSLLNMTLDLENFVRMLSYDYDFSIPFNGNYANPKFYKDFYNKFQDVVQYLQKKRLNIIFIFDNLSVFHYLDILFKLKNFFLKIIITSTNFYQEIQGQYFDQQMYNTIELYKLNENDCYSILDKYKHCLNKFLTTDYNLNHFIADLLFEKNKTNNTIQIYKINRLLNIFNRKESEFKSIKEYLKYKDDILFFISFDNKSAFNFLMYISFCLDNNNLRIDLLKNVYRLINYYDSKFESSQQFRDDFTKDLQYLINMSLITKQNENNYLIHDIISKEFQNLKYVTFGDELKIIFINLLALNQIYELDPHCDKRFYNKHISKILPFLNDSIREYLDKFNNRKGFVIQPKKLISLDHVDSMSINTDDLDNFLKELKQNELNKLTDLKNFIVNETNKFISCSENVLDKINEEIFKINEEIKIDLENKINTIKEGNSIDKLDPLKLNQIDKLKKSAQNLFSQVQNYKLDFVKSYNKKKNELECSNRILSVEIKEFIEFLFEFYGLIPSSDKLENIKFLNIEKMKKKLSELENRYLLEACKIVKILFEKGIYKYTKDEVSLNKLGKLTYEIFQFKHSKNLFNTEDYLIRFDLEKHQSNYMVLLSREEYILF